MPPSGDNRSIHVGGNATGAFVTGDNNTVTATTHVTLPPPATVDPKAELAALRELLARLQTPDRGKLDRAFDDAEEEAAKPDPDKAEIGSALQRVLKAAKGANDFAGQVRDAGASRRRPGVLARPGGARAAVARRVERIDIRGRTNSDGLECQTAKPLIADRSLSDSRPMAHGIGLPARKSRWTADREA